MGANDKILTTIGMLQNDQLTQSAINAFAEQVALLMTSGNENGGGAKWSSIVTKFPPIGGPLLSDPDKILLSGDPFAMSQLFWFSPSPFASLSLPYLKDADRDYVKIFIKNIYEPVVKFLDINGGQPAKPLFFDPTANFAINIQIGDIPQFLIDFGVAYPSIPLLPKFAQKYDINLDLLKSFITGLPSLPPIPQFTIPQIPTPNFDFIIIGDLLKQLLVSLPNIFLGIFDPSLAASLMTLDLKGLIGKFIDLILNLFLDVFKKVGLLLIMPKLLSATMIVFMQDIIGMMIVDLIGSILGPGVIAQTAATMLFLV